MYLLRSEDKAEKAHVQLLGSGCILREVIAAADLLKEEWGVTSDVWSVPSFTELARDGREVERWNLLHPTQTAKRSYVEECLGGMTGPVIRSEEHTSELQSLMRTSYAVFCVQKQNELYK